MDEQTELHRVANKYTNNEWNGLICMGRQMDGFNWNEAWVNISIGWFIDGKINGTYIPIFLQKHKIIGIKR